MNFVSIDVETANSDKAICQIGIARFVNGFLVEEWVSLINPEDHFESKNVRIHGIDKNKVADAPKFTDVLENLKYFLEDSICVSHTNYDQDALLKTFEKYTIQPLNIRWLDSATVARRTWSEFSKKGYGLKDLCKYIGYEFKHHDALEDAKAAGQVLLAAIKKSELDLDAWLERVNQPSHLEKWTISITDQRNTSSSGWIHRQSIEREGNPEGSLHGEVILFTGLSQKEEVEAAKLAAERGCRVATNISKKITLLVAKLKEDGSKTKKYQKAEQMISEGHNIRILSEGEFFELIEQNGFPPTRE